MKQNFKTLACIFAAATIALFAASCKKEMFEGNPETMPMVGVKRTISAAAAMPQGSDKAYLDYTDGRNVKWELTDALNINGTNLPLASLNAGATSARFEGTTYAIPSGSEDIYWAVYPTTIVGAASGSTIPSNFTSTSLTVNFLATQTYDASVNALSGNTLMAGYASVPSGEEQIVFQMRNLGAVLKLHLTADASATNKLASHLVFSTTDGALAGDFTVDNNTTNPTVTPAAGATKTLTVTLTDGTHNYIDIASGADVYVILPPFTSKNLTMGIYNTDGQCTMKTINSTTMARNSIYANTINDICFCCPDGFSVSSTERVVFAPGNLQWSATGGGFTATTHATADGLDGAGTWRFAEHQWDYIGNAAGNTTAAESRQTQADWIDLFGWGTSGWNNGNYFYQPYDNSNSTASPYTSSNGYGYGPTDGSTYTYDLTGAYANADWGVYNRNALNATLPAAEQGDWRTPTKDEWVYILNTRTTCSGVRYAKATVNGVAGLIIVPDNWDNTTNTLNSTNTANASFTANTISTAADWTNNYEAAGCVFLPAAGNRYGTMVNNAGSYGFYWSSTYDNSSRAYRLLFYSGLVDPSTGSIRRYGCSVRLVKNI